MKTKIAENRNQFRNITCTPQYKAFDASRITQHFNHHPSIRRVLDAKKLRQLRNENGTLKSKDGRSINPDNVRLANSIASNYPALEELFTKLRKIAASDRSSGFINPDEFRTMSTTEIIYELERLKIDAQLIDDFSITPNNIWVKVNDKAISFLAKEMFTLHVIDHVRNKYDPEECFYAVPLCEKFDDTERYHIDLVYRVGSAVKFVLIVPTPNLDQLPNKLERILKTANRLRTSVSVVVSPNVNVAELSNMINSLTNYNTDSVKFVPYHKLEML